MTKGGEGGFEAINFSINPPLSPFVKGGSKSLNLMAVKLGVGYSSLLFLWLWSVPQQSLGAGLQRLFTTPQQRNELNELRKNPNRNNNKETEIVPKVPPYITFNGLVTRSVGPTTLWVNNENSLFQEGFRIEEQQRQGLNIPIQLAGQNQGFTLKPGQTLNTLNGEIQENFELEPNHYEQQ